MAENKHQVEISVEVQFSGLAGGISITGQEVAFNVPSAIRPRHIALAAAIGEHIREIRKLVEYHLEQP